MLLDIRYYDDPILRKKSLPIETITEEVKQLAFDMIETMNQYRGVGLAGVQVGKLLRIFVSNLKPEGENAEGEPLIGEPQVFINPHLTNPESTTVERNEGCLSFPGILCGIQRPTAIDVEALDLEGKTFKRRYFLYAARCMMHENDHLNGVLFIDRVKGKKRSQLDPLLRQFKKKYASKRQ